MPIFLISTQILSMKKIKIKHVGSIFLHLKQRMFNGSSIVQATVYGVCHRFKWKIRTADGQKYVSDNSFSTKRRAEKELMVEVMR